MDSKRKVEIFSAGCGCCEETINLVKSIACSSCDITVLDMNRPEIAERAKSLGVRSVPAVVIMANWQVVVRGVGRMSRRFGPLA